MEDNSESLDVSLDSAALDQLNSTEARSLLDTIDSLRELQVGEIIDLPQIIVVGDQSSGKSSVLEAISRVRFPAKSGLCTRFATELVLRRAAQANIVVKIQFAGGGPQQPWRRTGFDRDALPGVIREAEEKMGFRGGSTKDFSKDILRVEITGPDVYPLTLVDLPGFFHAETARQSREGKQIVDQLVESYMKQKNSIILAVVSANNQLANQKVLGEAKKHDPARERTLGVVTKPDLAQPGSSDEQDCLQLVRGQESAHRLTLGWHVLRNRSQGEEAIESDERDAKEERFFATGAWATISPLHRGAANLRKKLSKVLLEHIQKSLPRLITEIETNLGTRRVELERLGKPRSKPEDLRSYLLDIAGDFQRLARDAVDGRYNDSFFGGLDETDRKLRAQLRNLNRAFAATLSTKGASHTIEWDDETDDENSTDESNDDVPKFLQPFMAMYKFPDPEPISESDLNVELEHLASVNQGKEFPGSPNAELAVQLFKQEAEPWHGIANFHLDLVTKFARAFVEQLFSHVIGADTKTVTAILHGVVDPFFDAKKEVLEAKLDELLCPYKDGFGMPLGAEFQSKLSNRAARRLADQIVDLWPQGLASANGDKKTNSPSKETIRRMIENPADSRKNEFGTEKIIDMMVAYYEMSLRTFTDNIVNLAVENCLVCDIPDILTPKKVDRMNEDRLKELAMESEEVQVERETLRKEVESLKQGLDKCRQHRPMELTVLPSYSTSVSAGKRSVSRGLSPSPAPPSPTPPRSVRPTSGLVTASPGNVPTQAPAPTFQFAKPIIPPGPPAAPPASAAGLFQNTPKSFLGQVGTDSTNNTTSGGFGLSPKGGLLGNQPAASPLFGSVPTPSLFSTTGNPAASSSTASSTTPSLGLFTPKKADQAGAPTPSLFSNLSGGFGGGSSGSQLNGKKPQGDFHMGSEAAKLRYAGIDNVKNSWLARPYQDHKMPPDMPSKHIERFFHISAQDMFKNFSAEEMRLRDQISRFA